MAPSRGISLLDLCCLTTHSSVPRCAAFLARRAFSSFADKLSDPTNKVQSYVSHSRDPYLNLSIEDYILRKSPAESTVLFLYTNRPCVVIGRNQNPWSEVNLGILHAARCNREALVDTELPAIGDVDLVRRRSGGGTVFHDEGNLNWSITCPRTDFTRDRYAEMVVRALRTMGVDRARVNERHDIVLDQGIKQRGADPEDTHRTAYTVNDGPRPVKVSGSAYKLTRARALHHATTLLASPNLHIIPHYLRSPAKNFIEAKGVESVSSPVGNIGLDIEKFQERLQEEFGAMHEGLGKRPIVQTVNEDYLNVPDIKKGYEELLTDDWMWSQTPQFTVAFRLFDNIYVDMNVHHGVIKAFAAVDASSHDRASELLVNVEHVLLGRKLQDIRDWNQLLRSHIKPWGETYSLLADRLEKLLPLPQLPKI